MPSFLSHLCNPLTPPHSTGERPFKCKLCNFASTTQSHLSRHKRVHTGEKPYRCPWCDYRYRLIDPPTLGGADGRHCGADDQGVDRWGWEVLWWVYDGVRVLSVSACDGEIAGGVVGYFGRGLLGVALML